MRLIGCVRIDAEEVAGHDLLPMSLQELFPCRLPRSFRRWLDAVPFQNVPDGVVCRSWPRLANAPCMRR